MYNIFLLQSRFRSGFCTVSCMSFIFILFLNKLHSTAVKVTISCVFSLYNCLDFDYLLNRILK